ncbi:unnamed protein product [Adineta steineri]|uniref:PiggyBac transposable element-derived protein 4-like n=1 Tax=Adineta steineri TaxID=433720 RepID=A0A815FEI4_9BILA|nr:unnamed protein product [Adineta steineri]CAF4145756.1 unnamed protein product [Adineta steineri]
MISSNDSYSESDSDDSLLSSSSSSPDIDTDEEIDVTKWTTTPTVNRDPFVFVGNREIRVEDAQTRIEFWNYIFPTNLVQSIVYETNCYAESICNNSNVRQRFSRLNKWEPTNTEEFNVFIALLILQGIIRKPELRMYFTTDELLATPIFSKIITADRFQILLRMLHFENDQGPDNSLKKIWPVVEALRNSFKKLYRPGRFLNVDESLHLYKGRLSWKQYIPLKRARFGFKFFMLCDTNGYILDFIIYTGRDTKYREKYNDLPLSSRMVMTLVEDYLGLGHCIVMDNYYSSPQLFLELVKRKTDAVGTVRSNRKSLPLDFRNSKLKKNERIARYYKKVMALKWLDKKYVHILSTYHENNTTIVLKRQTQVEKPICIHEYNDTMGGVDMADQLIAPYGIPRKRLKKYYKKIFMILLDLAILNSYHLYKIQTQDTGNNVMTQLHFRIALVRSLLEHNLQNSFPEQLARRGRPSSELTPARLLSRHFPSLISPTENKQHAARRCHVCSHTVNKNNRARHESRYECTICNVTLCVDPCFRIYHTVLNF